MLGNHETTGVLGQVPGKPDQLLGQTQHPTQHRALGIEPTFTQTFHGRSFIAPVTTAISQGIDLIRGQTQRLGHIAHSAGRVVGADHGGQCRAGPAIALEHILQDFFAAFVLEVHINIRWFIAFPGEKTLEQHVHPVGVDLGNAQGKAHRRVSRRASALTKNFFAPSEGDNVLDRKEITLIAQLGDQSQFLVDQPAHLLTRTLRPARANALLGQMTQPRRGRMSIRHQLSWILITQLVEVERATPGNRQRFIKQGLRVQAGENVEAAQMPFAVGVQAQPGVGHRQVMTDRGHGVLQGTPPARMHVHIAAGHRSNLQLPGQAQQIIEAPGVVLATMQLYRQPQAFGENLLQPMALLEIIDRVRHPQRQQPRQRLAEVIAQYLILAFLRAPSGAGDQSAQRLVTLKVLHQQHQFRTVLDANLAADNQRQLHGLRRLPGADDAGQGAFVSDRQGLITLFFRPLKQLKGTGGAALETEVRQAVQLGIFGVHANQPCNHNGPSSPTAR
ncbi:hypothetical protein D3C86_992730 [compost metagenome]